MMKIRGETVDLLALNDDPLGGGRDPELRDAPRLKKATRGPVPPIISSARVVRSGQIGMDGSPMTYRYHFWRRWMRSQPMVLWVLHNPGTGDDRQTDAVLERLTLWSWRLGFGGFVAAAIYPVQGSMDEARRWALALRESSNGDAASHFDEAARAVGELANATHCLTRVAAWGKLDDNARDDLERFLELLNGKAPARCLGVSENGDPLHPSARGSSRPDPNTRLQAFTYPVSMGRDKPPEKGDGDGR